MYLIPFTFHYFLLPSFININNLHPPHTITTTSHKIQSRPLHSTTTTSTTTRGSNYGPSHNSTIPLATTSAITVNVRPPIDAPKSTWQRAWNIQKRVLPYLHRFDSTRPIPNADLCLACLWWKALSGGDVTSPVYDHGIAYDCLPSVTRRIASRRLVRLYPRLHHANVEIRTAYLDKLVRMAAAATTKTSEKKCRLVSLGAGYDTRSIRMMMEGTVDECVELDREVVVTAKERMMTRLQRRRRRRRRQRKRKRRGDDDGNTGTTLLRLPQLRSVDLNNVDGVKTILKDIVVDCDKWNTIFLFEGVMIYLDESVPSRLLKVCSDVLLEQQQQHDNSQQCCDDDENDDDDDSSATGFLCFADRLENVPGGDEQLGREEFSRNGWTLINWLPKPGLARHMGLAELSKIR